MTKGLTREEMIEAVQAAMAAELAKQDSGKKAESDALKQGFLLIVQIVGTVDLAMVPFDVVKLYDEYMNDKETSQPQVQRKNSPNLVPAPQRPPLSPEQQRLLWGDPLELLRSPRPFSSSQWPPAKK